MKGTPKGKLVMIGGGKDTDSIFEKIFTLVGGKNSVKLAILPTASSNVLNTSFEYHDYFIKELGLSSDQIWTIPIAAPEDEMFSNYEYENWKTNANNTEIAKKIGDYNIIYMVGGDQRRYLKMLKNKEESLVLKAIKENYFNGGIIAGTSAGSNIQSETMISGGRSEEALSFKIAYTNEDDDGDKLLVVPGFGLLKNAIVDTHFNKYGRLGRLIEASTLNGMRYGFGVGERTCIIFHDTANIEVFGYGKVIIVDLQYSHSLSILNGLLKLRDIRLHILSADDRFNLETSDYLINEKKKNIDFTPFYGKDDYYISLNVFGKFEIEKIIAHYILDNEAKDAIGIMDFDKKYIQGDKTTLLHFAKIEATKSYHGKYKINETDDSEEEIYSGINVKLNLFPLQYEDSDRSGYINSVFFVSRNDLHIIVYDNKNTNPILDAKVEITRKFDNDLVYRWKTNKFGKLIVTNLEMGKEYEIKISYGSDYLTKTILFDDEMNSYCMK